MTEENYDKREFTAEVGVHTPTFLPGLSAKTGFKREWTAKRGNHFIRALTSHARTDADEIGKTLDEGGEAAELVLIAGERASRNGNEGYRDLLARLVAAALIDESKIDPTTYLLSRITELDPVHLRVLAVIDEAEECETQLREIESTEEREQARRAYSNGEPLVLYGRIQSQNVGAVLMLDSGIIEAILDDLAKVMFLERRGGELRPQRTGFVYALGDSYSEVFWRLVPLGRAAAEMIRSVKADIQQAD